MKLGDRYLVMKNGFLSDCIIICSISVVQKWSAFLRISRQILSNKNNMRFFKTIKLKLEMVSFNYRLMAKLLNYFIISNVVSLFKFMYMLYAVSICAWFLKCQFGSLLQTRKKNQFQIKLDFFWVRTWLPCVPCKNQFRNQIDFLIF